ncbi:MAG: MFS transporter [Pseudomonadota bacterium]
MSQSETPDAGLLTPKRRLSQTEFIAMTAFLFSIIAFSTDAMLPALDEIANQLSPGAPNRAQLIVTSFILGMGLGTIVVGPLSDAYGRKPLAMGGAALYIVGSAVAWHAQSLETMLAARVLQGLGAAGPRVVALAMVRDLYAGRTMARIMSFVILIFTLIPAFAPTLGAGIIWLAGWRGIFAAFAIFAIAGALWLGLRQGETLDPKNRRPFNPALLLSGIKEIIGTPSVARSIATQALCFAMLFATLSTTQPIFDVTFGQGDHFHLWFGLIALLAGTANLLNAALVERLGMQRIITAMLAAQIVISLIVNVLFWTDVVSGPVALGIYVAWTVGIFFQAGMTLGNLNALAMEPMGHLAGLTASVAGSVGTVVAVMIAAPIGLLFDGTPKPLMLATLILAIAALALARSIDRSA